MVDPVFRNAVFGSDQFDAVLRIMSAMLSGAAMDQRQTGTEPIDHTGMTISAAGLLAGYLTGALIVAGGITEPEKQRVGKMLLANFRQGIVQGKANALKAATDGETVQ